MDAVIVLMEYHRELRAKRESNYLKGLPSTGLEYAMNLLSVKIKKLKWKYI